MAKKFWVVMPSNWIHNGGLCEIRWTRTGEVSNAHKIAALQLYIAISMTCENIEIKGRDCYASSATYNKLQLMTGLSRASVAGGLSVLETQNIVEIIKEGRKNYYRPADYNGRNGWCKVPYRRLVNDEGQITAFQGFKLRRVAELHALKLYLYLCYARQNNLNYTSASYEKINKATRIPEKDIPRAYTVLAGTKLLSHIDKSDDDAVENKRMANAYYITGYRDLIQNSTTSSAAA